MKEVMAKFLPMWDEFILNYGWYIIAFLIGMLAMGVIWFIKSPHDFYTWEEVEDADCSEAEESR